MKTMLSDDKNIAAQLQTYIAAFSPAAAEVLDAFHYQQTIARLSKAGILDRVLGDFADIELHPDVVSNEVMGYIFEELLRRDDQQLRVVARNNNRDQYDIVLNKRAEDMIVDRHESKAQLFNAFFETWLSRSADGVPLHHIRRDSRGRCLVTIGPRVLRFGRRGQRAAGRFVV